MGEQKSISRIFLSAADTLVNLIAILALALAGMYAGYALWDNNRIYSAAEDVRSDMIQWKPVIDEDGGASFEELLAVNPDVCAWVTLDRTSIDYPVLQGETNLTYINTDVYGNLPWPGVFSWIPVTAMILATLILCSTATTWRIAGCLGIWIFIRMRRSSQKTPPER